MATKGAIWIWLSLLALRGLVVFCLYLSYQPIQKELQQGNLTEQIPATGLEAHHGIHRIHTAGISFFVLD